MRFPFHNGPLWAEALSDLGASLGFSTLALEVARTGEAFWVGFFAALGYLTLGPLLLLSPWVERRDLARALLELRLARGLLFLPLPFLPREAALLVLYAYPLMVLTDLAVVAWEGLLVRRGRDRLAERSGKLYAAWEVGGLVGVGLGPALFALHPALPYFLAAGILLLAWALLRPALTGEKGRGRRRRGPRPWGGPSVASWPMPPSGPISFFPSSLPWPTPSPPPFWAFWPSGRAPRKPSSAWSSCCKAWGTPWGATLPGGSHRPWPLGWAH